MIAEKGTVSDMCIQDGSWANVVCSTGGIADYTKMPFYGRWADVKADDAWCAAIKDWTFKRDSGTNSTKFTNEVMANFLKGGMQVHCEKLTDSSANGCIAPSLCQDKSRSSAAAMQLI
jgi:hypothetical protein